MITVGDERKRDDPRRLHRAAPGRPPCQGLVLTAAKYPVAIGAPSEGEKPRCPAGVNSFCGLDSLMLRHIKRSDFFELLTPCRIR